MQKTKIFFVIFLVMFLISLLGCQKIITSTTTSNGETITTAETSDQASSSETTKAVDAKANFTYEELRKMAKAGKYDGKPAKGHKIAFANLWKSLTFCNTVEEDVVKNWELAGGSKEDIIILDNAGDLGLAVKNADIILNQKPEVFIEYQMDAKTNAMIGRKAKLLNIPIIGVDVPVPGFPFQGADCYGAGALGGAWAAENLEKIYGSIDNIDRIYYLYYGALGELVYLRTQGAIDEMVKKFGDKVDPSKEDSIAKTEDIFSNTDEAKTGFMDVLAKYPEDKNIVVFTLNDEQMAGVYAAAEVSGKWDAKNWTLVAHNVDDLGKEMLKKGIYDADVAYFPEKYGEYLIPGALATIYGNEVPPFMYVDHVAITPETLKDFYPES